MRRALLAGIVIAAACGHPEPPETPRPTPRPTPAPPARPAERPPVRREEPVGAPFTAGPAIRIGVVVDLPRTTLGGGTAQAVTGMNGATFLIPAGRTAQLLASGGRLTIEGEGTTRLLGAQATVEPAEPGGLVRAAGKDHRGTLELRAGSAGLVVIARLSLETYLGGVVAAELGIPNVDATEALKSQAVIARTYAVKQMGRYSRRGFDLLATVADQRYDGVAGETSAAWLALVATKGEVLTYGGTAIDAFFHSTCSGRTASGVEVFSNADRPYLRSVSDLDANGQAWCRSSPRFRWTERWDQSALVAALRKGLSISAEEAAGVRSIEATRRSPSGRVTQLRVRLRGRDVVIDGSNAARRALPPADLDLLRSATFTLTFRNDGDHIDRLEASGEGSGHGVGLCQWGAIGRARAGQRYAEILTAYYPGTRIEHRW